MSIQGLTPAEIEAEIATALPDKEVVSILDLNVDVDVFLDVASPIDLAVAAQLNVAAPIDAAAGANVLSTDSTAGAMVDQTRQVDQTLWADATATLVQDSAIDQSDVADGDPDAAAAARRWRHRGGRRPRRLSRGRCSMWTSTSTSTPTCGPDRRCRCGQRQRGRADQRRCCRQRPARSTPTRDAVSIQDAIITQDLSGVTDAASSDQDSDVDAGHLAA